MDGTKGTSGRTITPERLSTYEAAGDPIAPTRAASELMRHLEATRTLLGQGKPRLARGAMNLATTAALHLATTSFQTEREHERKMDALDRLVATIGGDARIHVAALLEAALWADAARRHAASLRTFRRGLQVRPLALDGLGHAVVGDVGIARDDLVRYDAAVAVTDADHGLLAALEVVRDLRVLPRGAQATNGALSTLSGVAFGLCIEPAASIEARLDMRGMLVILWRTLRKRRPLAAAVLRRRLALDRERWPGPSRPSSRIGRA